MVAQRSGGVCAIMAPIRKRHSRPDLGGVAAGIKIKAMALPTCRGAPVSFQSERNVAHTVRHG